MRTERRPLTMLGAARVVGRLTEVLICGVTSKSYMTGVASDRDRQYGRGACASL